MHLSKPQQNDQEMNVHPHFLDAILVDFLQELDTADENGGHKVTQSLKDIPERCQVKYSTDDLKGER